MKPVYFPIVASIAAAIGFYRMYLSRMQTQPTNKENGIGSFCVWGVTTIFIWAMYSAYNKAKLIGLKETFDRSLAQAKELTLPETTCFVGMHHSQILPAYDIGRYTNNLPRSPSMYIQHVVKAIQDSNAIPNNRHLAQLIAEYAIEVHIIFWCRDTERSAILYQSFDSGEANRLVPPSALPCNPNELKYPVYWNSELCDFELTHKSAKSRIKEYWLLHLSGSVNPKLLLKHE